MVEKSELFGPDLATPPCKLPLDAEKAELYGSDDFPCLID